MAMENNEEWSAEEALYIGATRQIAFMVMVHRAPRPTQPNIAINHDLHYL